MDYAMAQAIAADAGANFPVQDSADVRMAITEFTSGTSLRGTLGDWPRHKAYPSEFPDLATGGILFTAGTAPWRQQNF